MEIKMYKLILSRSYQFMVIRMFYFTVYHTVIS